MTAELVVFAVGAYLIAGAIKGTIGLGMPMAAISLFAQASGDTRLAIALVIVPTVLTNAWQCWRCGQLLATLQRFRVLAVTMLVSISIASFVATKLTAPAVTLSLGIATTLFAVLSLLRDWPPLAKRFDRKAQWIAGVSSGVMGGVAGVWAPPVVVYLTALRVDKDTFVRASGVLFFIGGCVLAINYGVNGLLTRNQALAGALLVVPAILGYALGERLRTYLSGSVFRKVVLVFFLVMGLNLIRRGLVGA